MSDDHAKVEQKHRDFARDMMWQGFHEKASQLVADHDANIAAQARREATNLLEIYWKRGCACREAKLCDVCEPAYRLLLANGYLGEAEPKGDPDTEPVAGGTSAEIHPDVRAWNEGFDAGVACEALRRDNPAEYDRQAHHVKDIMLAAIRKYETETKGASVLPSTEPVAEMSAAPRSLRERVETQEGIDYPPLAAPPETINAQETARDAENARLREAPSGQPAEKQGGAK